MAWYVAGGDGNLYAFQLATGRLRWRRWINGSINASPVVGDGTVYVVDLGGDLHAVAADSGRRQWRRHVGVAGLVLEASPALAHGVLYVAGDGTVSGHRRGDRHDALMAVGGDRHVTDRRRAAVYVGGSDGWLRAIDGATGRERWRVRLGGVLVSSPAVHGGNVYLGGTQGLAALGG